MKVNRVLCPIDFSDNSKTALNYASQLVKDAAAELHVVYVYESGVPGVGYITPDDLMRTKAQLEAIYPDDRSVTVRHQLVVGEPLAEIVRYVHDNEIDLIVMHTHGRSGVKRLLMGSVAEAVVRKAPCPVLTIRTSSKKLTAQT